MQGILSPGANTGAGANERRIRGPGAGRGGSEGKGAAGGPEGEPLPERSPGQNGIAPLIFFRGGAFCGCALRAPPTSGARAPRST